MKGGFSSQKDDICFFVFTCKCSEPGINGLYGKRVFPVLFSVDITMPALEVTSGQDVKENIGGIFGKGNGFLHV